MSRPENSSVRDYNPFFPFIPRPTPKTSRWNRSFRFLSSLSCIRPVRGLRVKCATEEINDVFFQRKRGMHLHQLHSAGTELITYLYHMA